MKEQRGFWLRWLRTEILKLLNIDPVALGTRTLADQMQSTSENLWKRRQGHGLNYPGGAGKDIKDN